MEVTIMSQKMASCYFPHPMRDNAGNTHLTVEHFMMARKAELMQDKDTLARILAAKTPRAVKALGRKVQNWYEAKWLANREVIVLEGMRLKVDQHADLAAALRATRGMVLAEASLYDKLWGIGYASDHPNAKQPDKWKGANLLGTLWMRVRDELGN